MESDPLLASALVRVLVDAFKAVPQIKPHYLPWIAFAVGAILWPLYDGFSIATITEGILVGAGAVGLYEATKRKETPL